MKKIYLLLIFFTGLFILFSINVFASRNVNYNLTNLTLKDYIEKNNITNIKKVCTTNECFYFDNGNIDKSIDNMTYNYLERISDTETQKIVAVQGFKITKIIYEDE